MQRLTDDECIIRLCLAYDDFIEAQGFHPDYIEYESDTITENAFVWNMTIFSDVDRAYTFTCDRVSGEVTIKQR